MFDANGLLENKDVFGLIKDQNQNLWITSNNGLIVHHPSENLTRQFVYSDGIQSNLFTPQAIYKDDSGTLYFGGTNGFTSVDHTKIKTN